MCVAVRLNLSLYSLRPLQCDSGHDVRCDTGLRVAYRGWDCLHITGGSVLCVYVLCWLCWWWLFGGFTLPRIAVSNISTIGATLVLQNLLVDQLLPLFDRVLSLVDAVIVSARYWLVYNRIKQYISINLTQ